MSKLHNLSSVALLPELDLFSVPPTQLSIEKSLETEHRPTSTLNATSFIEFDVPTSVDEYILLSETYLHLKVKLNLKSTKTEKITASDWSDVIPANYFLHSLFKVVELSYNGKEITRAPQSYAYRAYIDALLGYSKEAKSSHLSSALWNQDDAKRSSLFHPSTVDKENGKIVDMMGKIHTDLTFQGKALLGGGNIKVKLVLNPPEFYLKLKNGLNAQLEIQEATLLVHRLKASPALIDAHSKALNVAATKYPITRVEVKQAHVVKGVLDAMIDNVCLGTLPRRIFVACVKNTAFNGSFSENPFNFDHFNINFIVCYIDGVQFPAKAYQPDFSEGNYVREYNGLFQALNQNNSDVSLELSREDYAKENVLFGFNFAPDLSNGCGGEGHVNTIKRGSLRIQLKFKQPLPETINVLIYCEFDSIIQINKEREVITDYN